MVFCVHFVGKEGIFTSYSNDDDEGIIEVVDAKDRG